MLNTRRLEQRERIIVGEATAVGKLLRHAHNEGRLVGMTRRPKRLPDGRVSVPVRILEPVKRPLVSRRSWVITGGAVGGLALLGGIAWMVAVAVAWVGAHLPQVIGAAVLAALICAPAAKVAAPAIRHCAGCRPKWRG